MKIKISKKYFKKFILYRMIALIVVYTSLNMIIFLASGNISENAIYFFILFIMFACLMVVLFNIRKKLEKADLSIYFSKDIISVPKGFNFHEKKDINICDITHIKRTKKSTFDSFTIMSRNSNMVAIERKMFFSLEDYETFLDFLYKHVSIDESDNYHKNRPLSVILIFILVIGLVAFIWSEGQ